MGCKYACICGGLCMGCKEYREEDYFGHAEDIMAQSRGFENADEMEKKEKDRCNTEMAQKDYDKSLLINLTGD